MFPNLDRALFPALVSTRWFRMSSITIRPRLHRSKQEPPTLRQWAAPEPKRDTAHGSRVVLPSRYFARWAWAHRLSQALVFFMCHRFQSRSNTG